jgi:hypothetical protein
MSTKLAQLCSKLELLTEEICLEIPSVGEDINDANEEQLMEALEDSVVGNLSLKASRKFNQRLGSILSFLLLCDTVDFMRDWSRENDEFLEHDQDYPEIDSECALKLRTSITTCHAQITAAIKERKVKIEILNE